ncbi:PREDICTED: reactive Intermediate Deaminase A, chloroplastic-like [Lupinus angustifolius]|uniref:reactive Intermediate Deaminase A, chloroplastic-like n=1 Tax=Lupinus angustifolius TaxID=3871 RepID=UPI00092F48FB|nr:PREDICTED: reactive Intermediate Deaminase A, chloroplastic-like [Lupinus angustifolius]
MVVEAVQTEKAPASLGTSRNVGEILKSGGASYSLVVKTPILLVDLKDFKIVKETYAKNFPSPALARATYQVSALPKDATDLGK